MPYSVSEASALAGVSVRTLHYYDEIGLLAPSEITEAGYRYYDEAALGRLQEILFFRELHFPLSEIRELMTLPGYSRKRALKKQKKLLEAQGKRLKALVELAEKAIRSQNKMSFSEFSTESVDKAKEKFSAEAREKWGETPAYRESEEKHAAYSDTEKSKITADMDKLIRAFSDCVEAEPQSETVQSLVKQWQAMITENHYACSDEILRGLADMYVEDERFTKNLDRFTPGTARLMRDAIVFHCDK